ncbi:MAG: hypothetical protein V4641_15040 [Pseudomonadota bacterium]
MPIDIVPKALYPLVPKLPGVPPMLRAGAQIFDTITLGFFGASDALNSIIGTGQSNWGIVDEAGNPIAAYDSFTAMRYRNESQISTYPVELGGFVAYNKVANPYDIQVVLTCGGSEARVSQFLVDIQIMQESLSLVSIISPEFTYESANITGIDYARTQSEGSHMIAATLTCVEVRQTARADFSTNKNPEADDPKSLGQIQTVDDPDIDVTGFA